MDTKKALEDTVEKLEHTQPSEQKHALVEQASKLHEHMTGHPMKFDKNDNLDKSAPEAVQCPALNPDIK